MEQGNQINRKWIGLAAAIAIVIAIASGLYWHKHSVNGPVRAALAEESNAKVEVYRRTAIGGSDIVFNVVSVTGEVSMADMMRMMLKSAEALKDRDFGRVYLASRGSEKFYLDGAYFKQLGEESLTQNPIYTVRTMPENVYSLDGAKAFGEWTGGLFAVVGKQMEEVAEFHRKWWLEDNMKGSGPAGG